MKSNPARFILCATDFSPPAIEAANVAARLAFQRSEHLSLVHATEATGARVLVETRRRLDAEAERLRRTGAVVDPSLIEGNQPSDALLEVIRARRPNLVVIGSGVKGPMDRWAMGSFSEQIAETSPVPTLVVRNASSFDSHAWGRDPLRVLLAVDRYATSDVVLRWAKEFKASIPCEFTSCYVNWRTPTADEAAIPPGRPVNPPELQARIERELKKKVSDQLGDDASAIVVRPFFGDPGPVIGERAVEVKADLIAVGTHQRRGLSRLVQFSVSRDLLHQSGMNVVCVPVTAKFDSRQAHIPDFRRILVATDFSDLGNSAIPFACAACAVGGLVRIVHVAKRARSSRGKGGDRAAAIEQLRALIPDEIGARAQPPEVDVIDALDVAEAICTESERFGADLVCLASHGLGMSRALHGSVTKSVLKKIRRPLLVIRRPEE